MVTGPAADRLGGAIQILHCGRELVRETMLIVYLIPWYRVDRLFESLRGGWTLVITCQHIMRHIEIIILLATGTRSL